MQAHILRAIWKPLLVAMLRHAGRASLCLALSAVFGACLAGPPDEFSDCGPWIAQPSPSRLDYMVLASIADAPRLLALAGYRSSANPRTSATPDEQADSLPMPQHSTD